MRASRVVPCALATLLAAAPVTLSAQQAHTADRADLDAAVAGRVNRTTSERARIRTLLQRPEVKAVADRYGFDLKSMDASVATLSGADLDRVASHANAVESALIGGDTITLTTTTLIIILLLVIIVILIA